MRSSPVAGSRSRWARPFSYSPRDVLASGDPLHEMPGDQDADGTVPADDALLT
jgi:hypothetical protein